MPGLAVHHQLPEVIQTHVHQVGDAIQPSCPLSSPSPPALNLSQHRVSNESVLRIRWPKYWSFSFSTSPSNEYSGLISFRMDWLGLLAVQGTLKSLLQHHSSKASILQHSAFFIVQLSHPSEKAMATHSSTLAWKIPWMEEPGRSAVHVVAKTQTQLGNFTFTFHFHALEKEMATHSRVLAWRIPAEPSGLPSMRLHRVGHD